MDTKDEKEKDWSPDDALIKERDISNSHKDELSHHDITDGEGGDIEDEVLIKPDEHIHELPANRKWSPRKNAFFFSKFISYFWMTNLFVKGSKAPLEEEDLEGMSPDNCSAPLTEKLEQNWLEEAYDENGRLKEDASLMKALCRTYAFQLLMIGFLPACSEVIRSIQPVFLGMLINYFATESSSKSQAYGYAFALVACHFVASWCFIPFNYLKSMAGLDIRVAVTGLIYKKVLGLSTKASVSTGHIVNLVSNDAYRFEIAALFFHYVWLAPIEFIIISYLLHRELGASAFAGIGVLLILTPFQMIFGNVVKNFRQKIFKHSDERVKVMNEIISGMKIIKYYAWEKSFRQWIKELRLKEIHSVRYLAYARAVILSFFFSAGTFVSLITFMTYVLSGNPLTAQKVFTSLALFNIAKNMFTVYLPLGLTFLMEVKVAVDRIQRVLLQDDIDLGSTRSALRPKLSDCKVVVENVQASWTEDLETLKGIDFEVKAGELLAVVGPVGSGKSSLLMAILGELPLKNGTIQNKGKVVYASQEPWIFNGTIKFNITFGHEFNQQRYNEVLKACALERDLQILPLGDETVVGERGVSLSGGQKARVNLARAVYSDADIYILDDPLSAVDAHVGRHLYDLCINGYLKDKVRILVTHQLQYLQNADTIVALVDGHCVKKGTFQDFNDSSLEFWNIVHQKHDDEDDEFFGNDEESVMKRRFSRILSVEETTPKKRAMSFGRQVSCTSRCTFSESTATVSNDVSKVVVYTEKTEEVVTKETKQVGSLSKDVYIRYFKAGPSKWKWMGTLLLMVVCQIIFQLADWWLANWANAEEMSNLEGEVYEYRGRDLGLYGFMTVLLILLGLSRGLIFFKMMIDTSNGCHMRMFKSIMRAPIYFFDTNSIGRILNRFSKDTSFLDDMLPFSCFTIAQNLFVMLGMLTLVSIKLPIFLALLLPIIIVFVMLRMYYIKTARELKRIEGIARSPVFGHFSTTLLGLPTIRAFGVQNSFFDWFSDVQDKHTEVMFTFLGSAGWLSFNLDLISGMLITFCSFVVIIFSDSFDGQAGTVGLLLTYAISIAPLLQYFVQQSTEVENYFTSVERVFEYCDLESEAPRHTDVRPPKDWPQRGTVTFDRLQFAYHRSLPNVLHGITAKIHSKEKIGVCGRTGAGKSSLLSTLFRTAEPSGKIFIDDQDITKIGLSDLRKKLSIIPQEPVLFSGTLRSNLDPFSSYDDKELWDVLEEVQLKDAVLELPEKLDSEMKESGQNLSIGQRQLICLARAMLKRNRVLVVDEATANVDPKTDSLIQQTIREKFNDCTVLTIAHRLHTIMDSDRIMVLDAGYLKEFNEPYHLLRCKRTILYGLVKQTGHDEAQNLFEISIKAHCKRHHISVTELSRGKFGDCGGGCPCGTCPEEGKEEVKRVVVSSIYEGKLEESKSLLREEKSTEEAKMNSEIEEIVEKESDSSKETTSDGVGDEAENPDDTNLLLPTTEL